MNFEAQAFILFVCVVGFIIAVVFLAAMGLYIERKEQREDAERERVRDAERAAKWKDRADEKKRGRQMSLADVAALKAHALRDAAEVQAGIDPLLYDSDLTGASYWALVAKQHDKANDRGELK